MQKSILFWLAASFAMYVYRRSYGNWYFIAAFPGTVAHELCHFFVAILFRARPHGLNLVPKKTAEGWLLGSVMFYPTMWNGSFVALAPLLLFPGALFLAFNASSEPWLTQLWQGYLFSCLITSAMPSKVDWDIVAEFPLGFAILLLIGAVAWELR